jgi:D-alanine transaminase
MSTVYLNGEYLPTESAKVSVLDRGFTFAEAIYEVIPVFGENIFRLREHLSRLDNSLQAIHIKNPLSNSEWQKILSEVLERNAHGVDRSLYVQVSRGVGDREHLEDNELVPTVFVMCRPAKNLDFEDGVSVVTHEDIRWKNCHIKATTLLANVMLKQHARDVDNSIEAILYRGKHVTEGAASNVFLVKDNIVKTPEKDVSVLPGITRNLVLELLEHENISCVENKITLDELKNADEIWLTSSSLGIAPVIRIDGNDAGNGKTGKLWREVNALYQEFKLNPRRLK